MAALIPDSNAYTGSDPLNAEGKSVHCDSSGKCPGKKGEESGEKPRVYLGDGESIFVKALDRIKLELWRIVPHAKGWISCQTEK
jgi:hypothetical protein